MIQWFPGHMAKAKREIENNLQLVDIVFELLDARIPISSRNPLINDILKNKPRLVLLTKADLADPIQTKKFIKALTSTTSRVVEIDSVSGLNIKQIVKLSEEALQKKFQKERAKGLKPRPIRAMIVGIPNVGKSTLINRLVNKKVTKVGDKPGVTKAQQWVRINQQLDLLDTPGVLWHKFDDNTVAMHLALTGAIKDEILRIDDLGEYLINFLRKNYPNQFTKRYNIDINLPNLKIANTLAKNRGFFGSDAYERALDTIINDFRGAKIGRITLDRLDES